MVDALSALTGKKVLALVPVSGGKNSRVYVLECADGHKMVVKRYHRHPNDTRNRLDTEFGAFAFLREKGVASVPETLFRDDDLGLGVYGFIPGERASLVPVTDSCVRQVVEFSAVLRELSLHTDAGHFSPASDACINGRAVVKQIESRLERLKDVSSQEFPEQAASMKTFLFESFEPALGYFIKRAERDTSQRTWDCPLPVEKRTLSPSDFGFHNAINDGCGRLFFVDFEYFGWDDPAKLISDFILHPAMALSEPVKRNLKTGFFRVFSSDDGIEARFRALYPLFGLKWCMILLNEFLDDQMDRRVFSGKRKEDRRAVLERQLSKAETMLNHVVETKDGNV
jgi:hypothetical protein